MGQKVVVELVDDLDGSVADDISTVSFSLDGAQYEIDLTEGNAGRLRGTLADYVAAARRTGGRLKRGTPALKAVDQPAPDRERTKGVREWARQNGFDMADRGRIPTNVLAAFEQAQSAPKSKARKGRAKIGPTFSG